MVLFKQILFSNNIVVILYLTILQWSNSTIRVLMFESLELFFLEICFLEIK
jgi:hypothetical protein